MAEYRFRPKLDITVQEVESLLGCLGFPIAEGLFHDPSYARRPLPNNLKRHFVADDGSSPE